jgi:hypothetical protein
MLFVIFKGDIPVVYFSMINRHINFISLPVPVASRSKA